MKTTIEDSRALPKIDGEITIPLSEYIRLESQANETFSKRRFITAYREIIQIYDNNDELVNDLIRIIRSKEEEISEQRKEIFDLKTKKGFKPFWIS